MEVVIIPYCQKCGEEVSEGVEFCPECGASLSEGSEQPARSKVKPTEAVETMFSNRNTIFVILGGVFIVWVGVIIAIFGSDQTVIDIGSFLNTLGFTVVGACLLGSGIINSDLDKFVRLGMILGGSFIIASTLTIGIAAIGGISQGLL